MKNLSLIFGLFFFFAGCVELEELEMITKIVKEPVSIDVQFIPATPEECEFGGYVTQITIEGQVFNSPPTCNGAPGDKGDKGDKGDPGEDGKDFDPKDLVFTYDVTPISDLCFEINLYLNGIPILTFPVCNGEKGDPGENGENFDPDDLVWTYEKVKTSEFCFEITLYVNGDPVLTFPVCNGEPGEDGENGEDSEFNIYIDLPDYPEEFDSPEGTDYYLAKEWELSCGVEIDQGDYPNGIGTLYLNEVIDDNFSGWGRTPNFTERLLTAVELQVGSSEPWEIAIFGQRFNGEWVFLYETIIQGNPHFVYNDLSTYEYVAWYLPSLDPEIVDYGDDFVRIEVDFWWRPEGGKKSTNCILDRNKSFNLAGIKSAGVKIPEVN